MSHVHIGQAMQIAVQHHQAGRLPQAEEIYRQILAQSPRHALAMHYLGVIAHQIGRNDIAVDLIGRAIGLEPKNAEAHSNLGLALRDSGQLDEAIAACRQAISLQPDLPEAYNNLGIALKDTGKLSDAIAAYRQAIALRPDYADAHNNVGAALKEKGQLDDAIAAYLRAIVLRPGYAEAHSNLGSALNEQGQLDEAIAAYGRAIALKPNSPQVHSNLVFALQFHAGYDARTIAREQRRWNDQHANPVQKLVHVFRNDRDPDRRLRIGYVSPDFSDHVVGRNLLSLFREHARDQFAFYCYSNVLRPDEMTAQFRLCADGWRSISGSSDHDVAELVREDRIDILVDLTLHMARNRLLVFARKPAPVQVTFGGYPGSTGLTTIDYRLTDPYLDPPGQADEFYSERSMRLPDSFWCYDPEVMTAGAGLVEGVGPLPALETGQVTFGCLNNFRKVNDRALSLWARVLRAVPGSRLLLMAPVGSARQRTSEVLAREGIDPPRLEFVALASIGNYFHRYGRIDIGLDTFPYNGHTTSLDALWMGVPVVTLAGETVVGRAGLSQLSNLNLTELVATAPDQYVRIAAQLAGDLPRLSELRASLRQRMRESSLTNAPRFARNIEAAYRSMWQRWCKSSGEPVKDDRA